MAASCSCEGVRSHPRRALQEHSKGRVPRKGHVLPGVSQGSCEWPPRLFCTRASTVTVAPRRAPSPPVPRRGCPGSSCPAARRLPPACGPAAPAPPRPTARRLRPVAALLTLSCPRGHGCLSTGHLSSPHSCPRLAPSPPCGLPCPQESCGFVQGGPTASAPSLQGLCSGRTPSHARCLSRTL